MALEFHREIIDRLPDPLLLLDEQGDVTGFNPAARALILSAPTLMDDLAPLIRAAITQAGIRPLRLNPEQPVIVEQLRYAAWLMPARDDMALILLPDDPQPHQRLAPIGTQEDVAFSALLSGEMRFELRRLIDKLGTTDADTSVRPELRRVNLLLSAIDILCGVVRQAHSAFGDRLLLSELVSQALARHELPASCLTLVGVTSTPSSRHVYGHAPWLHWALDRLLELLLVPRGDEKPVLSLHLRVDGSSVILFGTRNSASLEPVARPLSALTSIEAVADQENFTRDSHVGLALAQQIVDYHGGHLKLLKDKSQRLSATRGFRLSLPLGRPLPPAHRAHPAQSVPLAQAEKFARDLARLLPRSPVGLVSLSAEERDMLAHLCTETEQHATPRRTH